MVRLLGISNDLAHATARSFSAKAVPGKVIIFPTTAQNGNQKFFIPASCARKDNKPDLLAFGFTGALEGCE
jgi:hypothetical protein